jgi:hypothetical protein
MFWEHFLQNCQLGCDITPVSNYFESVVFDLRELRL